MKFNAIKYDEGFEAVEEDQPRLSRFKTGETYELEIKIPRNHEFHKKVFAFLNFCFEHWAGGHEFQDHKTQFDTFRGNLTVLAGFYTETFDISGRVHVEPKSISYGNMKQEEFERFYNALINAAINHIFGNATPDIENRLLSFF